jgi:glutamate synthase (NADPH/NADH) small chain
VVGSGPSGLAVAEMLNRRGFNVTVYEKAQHLGGLLRYGLPDFKLDKQIIERRIALMKEEGIAFETETEVGNDISSEYILRKNEALVLASGSRTPRDLNIPGRDLNGIHFALDFLTQQNRLNGTEIFFLTSLNAVKKRVVVMGGGDTGSDCIGTAIRQGAISVTQIEIMPIAVIGCFDWPYGLVFKETRVKEGCDVGGE